MKRLIILGLLTLAVIAGEKKPTVEELQAQVSAKDSQIAQLSQQVQGLTGRLNAVVKLSNSCVDHLIADEAVLAGKP